MDDEPGERLSADLILKGSWKPLAKSSRVPILQRLRPYLATSL
jgi:hypothetical protein